MDFTWSEEQTHLRQAASSFGHKELNDGLRERDKQGEFNRIGWNKCAEFGIHGLPIAKEYGGMGADPLTTVGVLESLGYGCRDNGLIFSINAHMWTLEIPLLDFGSEEQKRRYLPRLVRGDLIGGNAMSEPNSGSDAYSLRTIAERRGSKYVLNGSKIFVSNAPVSDLIVVYATVDRSKGPNGISGFLVEKDFPGFKVGRQIEKMGLRTSPMAELSSTIARCRSRTASVERAVAKPFSLTRWCGSGVAYSPAPSERCNDCWKARSATLKLASNSVSPIGKFQLVATKIVDMKMRLEEWRATLYRTAWLLSKGKSAFLDAALTKLTISENWVRCAEDAIQIHGGYGYMAEYDVERELRDALGSQTLLGNLGSPKNDCGISPGS